MQSRDDETFPENALYNEFPAGAEEGHGTDEGYNTYLKLNDPELFDPDKVNSIPALKEFVESGREISITFAQFKSSTRESEWALHKPHLTMDKDAARGRAEAEGLEDVDIRGRVDRYPGPDEARIATFFINHDLTAARWKQSVILIEDGQRAGQMIYKHPAPPLEPKD